MSVELVTGTFEPHVGETFEAKPTHSGEPIDLTLTSVVESPHARPDHPAFSLFFRASQSAPQAQQIFTLHNAGLGELDLFLVPVGPDEYEAVIN